MRSIKILALLPPLALAFALSACGTEEKTVVVNPPAGSTVVVPPDGDAHVVPSN